MFTCSYLDAQRLWEIFQILSRTTFGCSYVRPLWTSCRETCIEHQSYLYHFWTRLDSGNKPFWLAIPYPLQDNLLFRAFPERHCLEKDHSNARNIPFWKGLHVAQKRQYPVRLPRAKSSYHVELTFLFGLVVVYALQLCQASSPLFLNQETRICTLLAILICPDVDWDAVQTSPVQIWMQTVNLTKWFYFEIRRGLWDDHFHCFFPKKYGLEYPCIDGNCLQDPVQNNTFTSPVYFVRSTPPKIESLENLPSWSCIECMVSVLTIHVVSHSCLSLS